MTAQQLKASNEATVAASQTAKTAKLATDALEQAKATAKAAKQAQRQADADAKKAGKATTPKVPSDTVKKIDLGHALTTIRSPLKDAWKIGISVGNDDEYITQVQAAITAANAALKLAEKMQGQQTKATPEPTVESTEEPTPKS